MTGSKFCEINRKRYEDLTDRDVIRVSSTWDDSGGWREVLGVYRTTEHINAEFSAGCLDEPYMKHVKDLAGKYLDHSMESYVLVRVMLHEKSQNEVEDEWLARYRYDLVEVQSLPVWEPTAARPVNLTACLAPGRGCMPEN